MRRFHITLILIMLLIAITAQSVHAVSNAAVLYLRVAAGARPAGMGEAFVSIADDATATYWNPAGLGNAPISGMLRTDMIPDRYGEINDIVTLRGYRGTETWIIAGDRLLRYEGGDWQTGEEYETSSDQTLIDFLKTIINTEDEEKLGNMAKQVIAANCDVTQAELDSFIASVRTSTPTDYSGADDLRQSLENLETGYRDCRLKPDHFRTMQKRLFEGLEDGSLTSEELDRITYSLDRTVGRFLPGRLVVPFSTGVEGKFTCLGATDKYLWVGTDDGLYRRSGIVWARFTADDVLPSNQITCMANFEDYLMIGTDRGIIRYYHGSFTAFDYVPSDRVDFITLPSSDNGYAVIGEIIYWYDGHGWSDSYRYTVRVDDDMDKLAARAGIYYTEEEKRYLTEKIRELNQMSVSPAESPAGSPTDSSTIGVEEEGSSEMPSDAEVVTDEEEETDTLPETEMVPEETQPVPMVGHAWLTEGNRIKLPFSPRFRYDVTAMGVDLKKTLWVGTTSGLLSFDGSGWTRHGYKKFIVPKGDTLEHDRSWKAADIARQALPGADSTRISLLATNIDEYNDLNGAPLKPGDSVYVYSSNIGAKIVSVGVLFGDLFVGTEYGLMKKSDDGWDEIDTDDLDRRRVFDVYSHDGKSYYASSDGVTTETSGTRELALMHVKWLPNLDLDMYYEFASYVQHFRGLGTFGASIIYLTYGTIQFTDASGNVIGEGHPYEIAMTVSYGTSITSNLKWGMTGKFIYSHLSEQGAGEERGEGIASAFAIDMGILYKLSDRLTFGAAATNLGPEISYIDAAQSDPLPRNFGVGFSYRLVNSDFNRLIMQIEANKLLVDMNRGFSKEMETAIRHIGAEYVYANLISLRAGYKYDKEGQVKHLTFGAGLSLPVARLDFAYVPSSEDSPLANTLRISASFRF